MGTSLWGFVIMCLVAFVSPGANADWTGSDNGTASLRTLLAAEGVRPGGASARRLTRIVEEAAKAHSATLVQQAADETEALVLLGRLSSSDALMVGSAVRNSDGMVQGGTEHLVRSIEECAAFSRASRPELAAFLRRVLLRGSWIPEEEVFQGRKLYVSSLRAIEVAAIVGLPELIRESEAFLRTDAEMRVRFQPSVEQLQVYLSVLKVREAGAGAIAKALIASWSNEGPLNSWLRERYEWQLAVVLAGEIATLSAADSRILRVSLEENLSGLTRARSAIRAAVGERLGLVRQGRR